MEVEFDKEIDAILRKARAGEVATSLTTHLDADEISAFAENAVAEAARQRFTAHLADCTRCRKILSDTILLNSEAETETASSAVSAAVVEESVPWYRKFFVFPQLAYTMGAMVLLFSGFFGYLILKNLPTADRAVSYSTENRALSERPGAMAPANTASNSSAASNSNTAASSSNSGVLSAPSNATTTTTTNSAPLSTSNTTTVATPSADAKANEQDLNAPAAVPQATPAPEAKPQDKPVLEREDRDELAKVSPVAPYAGAANQNRAKEENQKQKKDVRDSTFGDDNKTSTRQESQLKSVPVPKSARKQPSNAGESRNVGGKTFNNVGGIWFDAAYGKQKQKTVRRGTSEYLRLDSGLRSIADNLGGTVVILWNGKAYRIQ